MTSFAAVLASAEPRDAGFAVPVPETWHQGRTAYGGVSTALAFAAARQVGGELPPLRSAQVSMIAPLTRTIEVRARVLRRGRNAVWLAAEIADDRGTIGLTATFVFMAAIDSALRVTGLALPIDLIAPGRAQPLMLDRGATFLRHNFDVRFALSRSSEKRPEMCWWVRLREPSGLDGAGEALLVADALPPGVMPLLAPTVPVSTMQWQVNLLSDAPATAGWWLLRSRGDHAQHGASSQRMTLWNEAGETIGSGTQSLALFG